MANSIAETVYGNGLGIDLPGIGYSQAVAGLPYSR